MEKDIKRWHADLMDANKHMQDGLAKGQQDLGELEGLLSNTAVYDTDAMRNVPGRNREPWQERARGVAWLSELAHTSSRALRSSPGKCRCAESGVESCPARAPTQAMRRKKKLEDDERRMKLSEAHAQMIRMERAEDQAESPGGPARSAVLSSRRSAHFPSAPSQALRVACESQGSSCLAAANSLCVPSSWPLYSTWLSPSSSLSPIFHWIRHCVARWTPKRSRVTQNEWIAIRGMQT